MKNIDFLSVSTCLLRKNIPLRISLGLIIILFIILLVFKAPALSMVFLVTLPLVVWLALIQIVEKVKLTGCILFDSEKITIQQEQGDHVIHYKDIKNIKVKGTDIKGDVKIMKGFFFYLKKGCNNWIIICDNNNLKYQYQIQINNEMQYRMLKAKIKEIETK